ncbi:DUF1127 domain-containing protein [Primorskyibacter aestuariivivens]|uniref:DUF1127 domain-containing protein n=1 Tax=Primorskyibacter aestuariivivens TaxID=1888912 RepID=UPI0023001E08|nr:DUF1127 domain-containing protein [Primorskyibacter aestuariivivens]MDA7427461.1 DUF1127 domain-containing protein [Primorskyibacter aestuariivivens]
MAHIVHINAHTRKDDSSRRHPGILGMLVNRMALYRQRKALLRLDDHLLEDLGITRDEARREAHRPVWDAPDHWKG